MENQRLEDLERLVDLGLVDSHELGSEYREIFIHKLMSFLESVGVNPLDQATPIQKKRGTSVIQFIPSDILKIFTQVRFTQGLSRIRLGKLTSAVEEINLNRDKFTGGPDRHIFSYSILRGSVRYSIGFDWSWIGGKWTQGDRLRPTSNEIIKFDGSISIDEMMAAFFYQVALDAVNYIN